MLDAKSAFDDVPHSEFMRKLFSIGFDSQLWILVNDLHVGAVSSLKWQVQISTPFDIQLEVRQGGILTEQARLSGIGATIGNIPLASPAVCDDLSFMTTSKETLRRFLNMSEGYSGNHKYCYQARKSAVLPVYYSNRVKPKQDQYPRTICSELLPVVEKTTHLGIVRAKSQIESVKETFSQNISKSRRTLYSLMSSGVHDEKRLDIETKTHIFHIYVPPVLTYGLKVLLPKGVPSDQLEKYLKRT